MIVLNRDYFVAAFVDIPPFAIKVDPCQALAERPSIIILNRDNFFAGFVDIPPFAIKFNHCQALAERPSIIVLCRDDHNTIFFEALFPILYKFFVFGFVLGETLAFRLLLGETLRSFFGETLIFFFGETLISDFGEAYLHEFAIVFYSEDLRIIVLLIFQAHKNKFVRAFLEVDEIIDIRLCSNQHIIKAHDATGYVGLDMHLAPCCGIGVSRRLSRRDNGRYAMLHKLVESTLKEVVHHHCGYLVLPKAVFNHIRQAVDVVKPLKHRIGINRDYMALRHKGALNLFPHPILLVFATVESVSRKYEKEHLRRLDCSLDATVENTIFQLIKIEKYIVALVFKRKLHLAGEIRPTNTPITDKYVVIFHFGLGLGLGLFCKFTTICAHCQETEGKFFVQFFSSYKIGVINPQFWEELVGALLFIGG